MWAQTWLEVVHNKGSVVKGPTFTFVLISTRVVALSRTRKTTHHGLFVRSGEASTSGAPLFFEASVISPLTFSILVSNSIASAYNGYYCSPAS